MNLNQILPGTDYAWFPQKGRGEEFRFPDKYWPENYNVGVHRVKAIRPYSERLPGNKRETGYVDCFVLTNEGEFKPNPKFGQPGEDEYLIKKVRVRDIATLWDEYADELDYRQVLRDKEEQAREARRQEQEAKWEAERLERERRRQEQLERERIERERAEAERKAYLKRVEDFYRLPPGSVQYNGYGDGLILNKVLIDEELNRDNATDTTTSGWLSSR